MKLKDLLPLGLTNQVEDKILSEFDIKSLCLDSRKVEAGSLFFALKGSEQDGTQFCESALKAGASVILVHDGYEAPNAEIEKCVIRSSNPRYDLSQMAARFYQLQPQHIAAVTGTNGKTSTAWFCYQIWEKLGLPSAFLGTLGFYSKALVIPGKLTTPDAITLHDVLKKAKEAGVDHIAIEASSHGLDQYRLHGARVSYAAYTNLTPDHLDYHRDMDDYFAAKQRLFTDFRETLKMSLINRDDARAALLVQLCEEQAVQVQTYGGQGADLEIMKLSPDQMGLLVDFRYKGDSKSVLLPCFGDFQAYNLMAAVGICMASGYALDEVLAVVPQIEAVPGRMEPIMSHNGARIIVDYAHAGDALVEILKEAKSFTTGKVYVVFGSGGDRDPNRRIEMGKAAEQYADIAIITDDNPRSEDPAMIRRMILDNCPKGIEIGDRRSAIEYGIKQLKLDDTLIIAGKGHEQGQLVKGQILPFDDRTVAKEIVSSIHETLQALGVGK